MRYMQVSKKKKKQPKSRGKKDRVKVSEIIIEKEQKSQKNRKEAKSKTPLIPEIEGKR